MSIDIDNYPPIVIDTGSYQIKGGLAIYDEPTYISQTAVGHSINGYDYRLVQRLNSIPNFQRHLYNIKCPITNGMVTQWADLQTLWDDVFLNRFNNERKQHPVLLTEFAKTSNQDKAKIANLLFNHYNVSSLQISHSGLLSLMSKGYTTGLAIDVGETQTNIIPILDCHPLRNDIQSVDLAGKQITNYLTNLIYNTQDIEYSQLQNVREFKEKFCYVNYKNQKQDNGVYLEQFTDYYLPDGQKINVQQMDLSCPNLLFEPKQFNINSKGIHEAAIECVQRFDSELSKTFFNNIIISGGTSMTSGFIERLNQELTNSVPNIRQIKNNLGRQFYAWMGGQILSQLSCFQSYWVTHDEYLENGPTIFYRKWF